MTPSKGSGRVDLSEEAETPARATAARQVGLVLGAVSAAVLLVLGVSHWSSPVLTRWERPR